MSSRPAVIPHPVGPLARCIGRLSCSLFCLRCSLLATVGCALSCLQPCCEFATLHPLVSDTLLPCMWWAPGSVSNDTLGGAANTHPRWTCRLYVCCLLSTATMLQCLSDLLHVWVCTGKGQLHLQYRCVHTVATLGRGPLVACPACLLLHGVACSRFCALLPARAKPAGVAVSVCGGRRACQLCVAAPAPPPPASPPLAYSFRVLLGIASIWAPCEGKVGLLCYAPFRLSVIHACATLRFARGADCCSCETRLVQSKGCRTGVEVR